MRKSRSREARRATRLHGATVLAHSADGTQLHAEVFGPADAATFVLVPGWTEELQFFDLVTRGVLGRGFRVVVYDLRGQGSSGGAPGLDQAIERYGEDLAVVLDANSCEPRDQPLHAVRPERDLDLTASLPTLRVPTLVVVGEIDRMTPPALARRMVAVLPHVAEFVLLPETGHMVPLERPDDLVDALVRLAGAVGLSGAVLPKHVRAARM